MTSPKTAIIIGAGPAGLTAAWELLTKTDICPIILEGSGDIGGISRTVEYHGNRMDIGGHRFFSKSDTVMDFWRKIMPLQSAPAEDDIILRREVPLDENGVDPEREDRVMLVRRRVSRIFYLRKFFDYPISMKPQTFINMGMWNTFRAGCGYLWASVFKRKEVTLRDFMINRFGGPLYRMFFEGYTQKVWGRNPKDISADWGKQRIRGISLSKALLAALKKPFQKKAKGDVAQKNVETSLIEQFIYPKFGPGQLWETLAADIVRLAKEKYGPDYEALRMDRTVTKFRAENNRVTSVETQAADGATEIFEGNYFVSSMPIKDLVEGLGEAAPAPVREVGGQLPYRDFITVGLLVKNLEIKNTTKMTTVGNIVPDCWIYIQEPDVEIGRLQVFNNWSPYMVKDLENTTWVGLEYFCNEGDRLWEMGDEEFITFAVDELCKIRIIKRENLLDSVRVRVKKAYPAYFGVYDRFAEVQGFLDGIANLYCVGRNGQHRYNNMDHSMLTAIEAARLIAADNPDKTTLWRVNTEEEYHESK